MGTFATTTSIQVMMVGTVFDSVTTSLVAECLSQAENEIKKQLSKRYDISTAYFTDSAQTPPQVQTMAKRLTIGYAYEAMARGSKEGFARADRYIKQVMENLCQLREGEVQLFDAAGILIEETPTEWQVQHTGDNYAPTFNEDDPKNWKVDRDKLEDIDGERD